MTKVDVACNWEPCAPEDTAHDANRRHPTTIAASAMLPRSVLADNVNVRSGMQVTWTCDGCSKQGQVPSSRAHRTGTCICSAYQPTWAPVHAVRLKHPSTPTRVSVKLTSRRQRTSVRLAADRTASMGQPSRSVSSSRAGVESGCQSASPTGPVTERRTIEKTWTIPSSQ